MGQRIIEVNGQSLLGASHNEAVSSLREAGECIQLLVCDGWNTPTPGTPEPNLASTGYDIDAIQPPYNTSVTNGQVKSVESVAPEGDLADRPPSANQEKVCIFSFKIATCQFRNTALNIKYTSS